MLCTARSLTLTCDLRAELVKKFLLSFMRLHTIDLPGYGFDIDPDDHLDPANLISIQGLFHLHQDVEPAQTWLAKATNVERLALSFEDVPHDEVVQFLVFLRTACPKIKGLKIVFLRTKIIPDMFRVLPRGLETLCLQFDSYNEIHPILSANDLVTERNAKDIEIFLKQWFRPQCNLIVQDRLYLETLDKSLGP